LGFNDSAVCLRALEGHDERVGDELRLTLMPIAPCTFLTNDQG
jgi:hypothetical protein